MLKKNKNQICSRGCEIIQKNKISNKKWVERVREENPVPRAITHAKFMRSHLASAPYWTKKFNRYRG